MYLYPIINTRDLLKVSSFLSLFLCQMFLHLNESSFTVAWDLADLLSFLHFLSCYTYTFRCESITFLLRAIVTFIYPPWCIKTFLEHCGGNARSCLEMVIEHLLKGSGWPREHRKILCTCALHITRSRGGQCGATLDLRKGVMVLWFLLLVLQIMLITGS